MTRIGAILAGGGARRFGSDKAVMRIGGVMLIDHAITAIAPWVDAVVVCGRDHDGRTALADRPRAGMGPLGGINAALHHARDTGAAGVLTIACDIPVLPPALAQALLAGGARVVAGQPMLGYWPVALADRLDAHLAGATDLSLRAWVRAAEAATVPADGRGLTNINTLDDLRAYIAAVREAEGGA